MAGKGSRSKLNKNKNLIGDLWCRGRVLRCPSAVNRSGNSWARHRIMDSLLITSTWPEKSEVNRELPVVFIELFLIYLLFKYFVSPGKSFLFSVSWWHLQRWICHGSVDVLMHRTHIHIEFKWDKNIHPGAVRRGKEITNHWTVARMKMRTQHVGRIRFATNKK